MELVVKIFGLKDFIGVLQEHSDSFPDEKRDLASEGDVGNQVGSVMVDFAGIEVIPVVAGEIHLTTGLILDNNWSCHQVKPDEELGVTNLVNIDGVIQGVGEEEGLEDGTHSSLENEDRVVVLQKGVPQL